MLESRKKKDYSEKALFPSSITYLSLLDFVYPSLI